MRLDRARFIVMRDHPDIVDVYDLDVGPEAGLFVIMEYVKSESLSAALAREGRLTPDRTMDLVAQMADALQAVHEFGVVHRQLGPDRLLIRPDGTVALSVFGLAHPHTGRCGPAACRRSARCVTFRPSSLWGKLPPRCRTVTP